MHRKLYAELEKLFHNAAHSPFKVGNITVIGKWVRYLSLSVNMKRSITKNKKL